MTELLAPAGSLEALRAAVNAGADAVYIGGRMFGARAYADNPDESDLIEGIEYCHLRGRKVYLTVNTLLKETELQETLFPFLLPLYQHGIDALIVQDLGVVKYVREHFPDLELHASTQMSVATPEGASLLARYGVSRVVPARELSWREVEAIVRTGLETEIFVHGAMCYSYSGRCLLSSMLGGRSGNRGRCAQPCRLPYAAEFTKENSIRKQTGRKREGSSAWSAGCLLSMKDMCTLDLLPDFMDAGIASFKIEGRMKRPEYAAGVTSIYRRYMDLYAEKGRGHYRVEKKDRQALLDLFDRGGFSQGYYHLLNGPSMIAVKRPQEQTAQAAQMKNERNQRFLQENIKVKINGDLRIYPESPVILEVWIAGSERGGSDCVKVTGEIPAPARTTAISGEDVIRQIQKTGGTDFVFNQLNLELAEGLFLPVRVLNDLRRCALESLKEKILKEKCRKERLQNEEFQSDILRGDGNACAGARAGHTEPRLNILATLPAQLEAVAEWLENHEDVVSSGMIDTIYLDSMLLGARDSVDENCEMLAERVDEFQKRGLRCLFSLPPVLRQSGRRVLELASVRALLQKMDGFLIHSLDELAFLKKHSVCGIFVSEDCLYTFNSESAGLLREEGITRFTYPAELNSRELSHTKCAERELVIYGYQPLMQSAQCVRKNTAGCLSGISKTCVNVHSNEPCAVKTGPESIKTELLYLRDRKNMRFPVLPRCLFCMNTIYNSVPLQLFGYGEEILKLEPSFLRISFTIETAAETAQILNQYGKKAPDTKGTRGHFKRGVE